MRDVRITEFGNKGMQAEVDLQLDNPNWYKVVLTGSQVELFLDGKPLGTVQLQERMIVPRKSITTQTMKVEADYDQLKDLLAHVLRLVFKRDFVLEGKGYVKGRALFVARKVPVQFREQIAREDLLGF